MFLIQYRRRDWSPPSHSHDIGNWNFSCYCNSRSWHSDWLRIHWVRNVWLPTWPLFECRNITNTLMCQHVDKTKRGLNLNEKNVLTRDKPNEQKVLVVYSERSKTKLALQNHYVCSLHVTLGKLATTKVCRFCRFWQFRRFRQKTTGRRLKLSATKFIFVKIDLSVETDKKRSLSHFVVFDRLLSCNSNLNSMLYWYIFKFKFKF